MYRKSVVIILLQFFLYVNTISKKEVRKKMNKTLENYLNVVIPQPLEADEYIRVMRIYTNYEKNKPFPTIHYVKTFEEVDEIVKKYKYNYTLYISLATYNLLHGEEVMAKPYRRQVIFLDFDQKDFPDFKDVNDYSTHIKERMPSLFNHCIVASGSGGYHYYIATEPKPYDEVVAINKKIERLTSADERAACSTQVARIPTSNNLKSPDNPVYVKIVNNVYGSEYYKPYKLSVLQHIIDSTILNNEIEIPKQEKPIIIENISGKYYCIEQMINLGCSKGERNFALGRICAKLKSEGYTCHKAKETVLSWNRRCSPPKSIGELESEFDVYWKSDKYKLLGCNLPDGKGKEILSKYCDKALCNRYQSYEYAGNNESIICINSKLLDKRNMQRLSGYHYLVIFTLIEFGELSVKALEEKLSATISTRKLSSILKELVDYKIVNNTKFNLYSIKKINSKYNKNIILYKTGLNALKTSIITKTEFLVYLSINVLLQMRNNATYDTISEYLDIEKSSISKYVNSLNKNKILKITKVTNEKGLYCNRYIFI